MPRPRHAGGFTLIELLMVIAIVGLLMTLLVPTISKATEQVRAIQTRGILKEISIGLENFRKDFGDFPPSRPANGFDGTLVTAPPFSILASEGDVARGCMGTGAANLVYYLGGPQRSGWGTNAGGLMPSAYSVDASGARPAPLGGTPQRVYGPYYQCPEESVRYAERTENLQYRDPVTGTLTAGFPAVAFLDAYKPPGIILYMRSYKRLGLDASGVTTANIIQAFDPSDNNNRAAWDPVTRTVNSRLLDNRCNYTQDCTGSRAQQGMFDLAVGVWTKSGTRRTVLRRYPRQDYMLISPGPDGRFGYVNEDTLAPTDPEVEGSVATRPDDITNWEQ